jgi:hypothetical protein
VARPWDRLAAMATYRRAPLSYPPSLALLENIRSQNRAILEAVLSSHSSLHAQIAGLGERLDGQLMVIEGIARQNSADLRDVRADVSEIARDVAQIRASRR